MASSLLDYIAISFVPLAWRRTLGSALRAGADPRSLLDQLVDPARTSHLSRRSGTAPDGRSSRYTAETLRADAAAALARADARGLRAIEWIDPRYPPALAALDDPPPVLWCRGSASHLASPAVAIVGSRAGSPYALAVAERLAADLASRGVLVVSGLARGVDSAAHRGALAGGGATLAVLGSGVDVIYPPEHATLAAEVAASGLVVSELPPGTPPRKHLFPQRNRLISGISRAVVVVEAGDRSGSLITARLALEQGREVLAVPGSVLNGRNRGGHALIRDGAKIVESVDDILDELGMAGGSAGAIPASHRPGVEPSDDRVWASLGDGEPADLDAIAARTGLAAAQLLSRLFALEMQGVVRRAGGGRFVRVGRSC